MSTKIITTDSQARVALRACRMSFRKIAETGEYRVTFDSSWGFSREQNEDYAFYTNDRNDAIHTGLSMVRTMRDHLAGTFAS